MQTELDKIINNLSYKNNGDFSQSIHSVKHSIQGKDMEYSLERIADHYLIFKTDYQGFEIELGDKKSFEEARAEYLDIIKNF